MSSREAELDRLLQEMSELEAPRRDARAEHRRRERMKSAMHDRLAALDARSRPRPALVKPGAWAVLAAAAVLLTAFAGVRWFARPLAPSVDAERISAQDSDAPDPLRRSGARAGSEAPPARSSENEMGVRPPRHVERAKPKDNVASESPGEPRPALRDASEAPADASLAAQNELFQSAVRASRRGDDAGALEKLDALLERYPSSVLAADARVRKFRILARLGRDADARTAAAQYLARHPGGFAEAEARKVLNAEGPEGAASQ